MHLLDRSGQITGTREQLARAGRCTPVEADAALQDLITTNAADVTERNGVVTVVNRRMKRDAISRRNGVNRVQKCRENAAGNGSVTPYNQNHIPEPQPNSESEPESNVRDYTLLKAGKGDSKGGQAQPVRTAAPAAPLDSKPILLSESNLRAVAVRILNNDDEWHYDNCKAPRTFTLGEIEIILRENVRRVTVSQCHAAWQEAITLTHQRIVDSHENEKMDILDKPEAYVKTLFRAKLAERWVKTAPQSESTKPEVRS